MRWIIVLSFALAVSSAAACSRDATGTSGSTAGRHALVLSTPVEDGNTLAAPGCHVRMDGGWLALDPARGRFANVRLTHAPCNAAFVLADGSIGSYAQVGDTLHFRDVIPADGWDALLWRSTFAALIRPDGIAIQDRLATSAKALYSGDRVAGADPIAAMLPLRAIAGHTLPDTVPGFGCITIYRAGALTLTPGGSGVATGHYRLERATAGSCASLPQPVEEGPYEAVGGVLYLEGIFGLVLASRIELYAGVQLEFAR